METPMTATRLLGEDHQRIHDLYQQLAQVPAPADQAALVQKLFQALEIHAWMEERLVYPILAQACQEDSLAHRLGAAHGEAKRLISAFRIRGGFDAPEAETVLARLMAVIQDHVREEEAQAFPLLAAGAAHNAELGADLARLKGKMESFPPFAHAIELAVPVRAAYNQWTQFEDFPRFLGDVKEVRQLGPTRMQWHAAVAGMDVRWTSEIYEQIPDVRIAWSSVEGALNAGSVSFLALEAGLTRILVELTYEPQGLAEQLGAMVGVLSRHVNASLRSYKAYLESARVESGAWRGKVEGTPLDARNGGGGEVRPGPGPS